MYVHYIFVQDVFLDPLYFLFEGLDNYSILVKFCSQSNENYYSTTITLLNKSCSEIVANLFLE